MGVGVESWTHYSNKAGIETNQGKEKWGKVVSHFVALYPFVPSLGACFIFGTDGDKGDEPVELTKNFIQQVPYVWPGISVPVPYGGTPFFGSSLTEGRILTPMPFSFYCTPYLVLALKNYSPLEYYEKLIKIITSALSPNLVLRRIARTRRYGVKILQALRTLALTGQFIEMRQIRDQLKKEGEFRAFHEGRIKNPPEFYRSRLRKRLGPYAELLSDREIVPELNQPIGPTRAYVFLD